MNTILVPLDGSLTAEHVLAYVRLLAPLLHAKIHLLRVIAEAEGDALVDSIMGHGVPLRYRERQHHALDMERQQAESYLASHVALLQAAGLDADAEVCDGQPAQTIIEIADREHVRLIVMATHGYSGLRRWALGSVAAKVVRATTTPVFVVRSTEIRLLEQPTFIRILLLLDGSELAPEAVPWAAELAMRARAELILLSVVPPPVLEAPERSGPFAQFDDALVVLRERLPHELGQHADELMRHQVRITPVAASGFTADTIIDEAMDRQVDLIVMATHGYTGVRRWALGSVADKVLHAAPMPLLLVHPEPNKR